MGWGSGPIIRSRDHVTPSFSIHKSHSMEIWSFLNLKCSIVMLVKWCWCMSWKLLWWVKRKVEIWWLGLDCIKMFFHGNWIVNEESSVKWSPDSDMYLRVFNHHSWSKNYLLTNLVRTVRIKHMKCLWTDIFSSWMQVKARVICTISWFSVNLKTSCRKWLNWINTHKVLIAIFCELNSWLQDHN